MNTLIQAPHARWLGARRPSSGIGAGIGARTGARTGALARAGAAHAPRWSDELAAFSPTGGVIDGDELTLLLRAVSDQPISLLAHWIVAREVLTLSWDAQTYLPKFQFDFETLAVRPGMREVISELRTPFDDRDLAQWFVRPNNWLAGRSPAEAIAVDPADVLQAARADRFVAMG